MRHCENDILSDLWLWVTVTMTYLMNDYWSLWQWTIWWMIEVHSDNDIYVINDCWSLWHIWQIFVECCDNYISDKGLLWDTVKMTYLIEDCETLWISDLRLWVTVTMTYLINIGWILRQWLIWWMIMGHCDNGISYEWLWDTVIITYLINDCGLLWQLHIW